MKPSFYVIAGPNGTGKSTTAFQVIPVGVEQINSDDIARQFSELHAQREVVIRLTSDEAQRRIQQHLRLKEPFSVETNLHDDATWQYFLAIQQLGYAFELIFFCTNQLETLVKRVKNRYLQGGHFVREDIIRGRYEAGLYLLNIYFDKPDALTLIDTSNGWNVVYRRANSAVIMRAYPLPVWVTSQLATHFSDSEPIIEHPSSQPVDTIDQVRALYQQSHEPTDPTTE